MKKTLNYTFGSAYCHDNYVYFERTPNEDISCEEVKTLMYDISMHYGKRKFVYISNRKEPTIIDINSYKYVNIKQMAALAIVTEEPDAVEILLQEQQLFDGPFAFFKTLDQAISWASTFELD